MLVNVGVLILDIFCIKHFKICSTIMYQISLKKKKNSYLKMSILNIKITFV